MKKIYLIFGIVIFIFVLIILIANKNNELENILLKLNKNYMLGDDTKISLVNEFYEAIKSSSPEHVKVLLRPFEVKVSDNLIMYNIKYVDNSKYEGYINFKILNNGTIIERQRVLQRKNHKSGGVRPDIYDW